MTASTAETDARGDLLALVVLLAFLAWVWVA